MYDFAEEIGKMFGGCNPFAYDEYSQLKGTTKYKLVKMKSGNFAIQFGEKLLDYRSQDKEEAKKYFCFLVKRYRGII